MKNKSEITPEKSKNKEKITPENFEERVLSPLKGRLNSFLGGRGKIKFKISEGKNFSFSPETRLIYIPKYWVEGFIKNQEKDYDGMMNEYTFKFLSFVIFHENSHYRDMLMELELDGKKSMLSTLIRINDEKISIGEGEYIPIGKTIHMLYNCLDDTVVNKEVESFHTGVSEEELIDIYTHIAFSSFEKKKGGSFKEEENLKKVYVGEGNGDFDLILDEAIDYTNLQLSTQLPYVLLRGKMVENQEILIDEKVRNIFFKEKYTKGFTIEEKEKFSRKNIKKSLESLKDSMKNYLKETKQNANSEELNRIKKIEGAYLEHIDKLDNLLKNYQNIEDIIYEIVQKSGTKRVNKRSTTLIDLLNFFSYSEGYGDEHKLKILPSFRYKAIENIFEPIQKGLTLMDLLKEDLKDNGNNSGKGEGEGKSKGEGNNSGKGEGEGKSKGEGNNSGELEGEGGSGSGQSHTLHESPSLKEQIKELESITKIQEAEENTKRKADEILKGKKQAEKDIKEKELKNKGIEDPKLALEIYNNIISKNTGLISSLVKFIKEQLIDIEKDIDFEEYYTKKGGLDYKKTSNEISKDLTGSGISQARIYTRKDRIEKLKENFKELDFYMLLDISGSMQQFKGKDGMLTIISAVLFNVMKQIEQVLQKETEDYEYKIPVNFLLYGDGDVYSTFGKDLEDEEIVLDMIDKSMRLSGGTNDKTGWNRIAQFFSENQLQDTDYVDSIKEGKKIPFIIQIADSDVSENGVDSLKKSFLDFLGDSIGKFIPIKRAILGEKEEKEIILEEFINLKEKGGNWDIKEVDGKLIKQSASVYSKEEIEKQLKSIFDGFLLEIFKNKKK